MTTIELNDSKNHTTGPAKPGTPVGRRPEGRSAAVNRGMRMPTARGPASTVLLALLSEEIRDVETLALAVREAVLGSADIVRDDDLQLALFCLYELHYGGIAGVDDDWEWHPALLAVRAEIEDAYEVALRSRVAMPPHPKPRANAVAAALAELTSSDDGGPGMSRYVAKQATDAQLHEFLVHRSIYTLKEADPHTWAIPRLRGRAKAALVEIQADEYGGGRAFRMHHEIFAGTMRGLGLDDSYGRYVDHVPAIILASANMMTMFGLHRRMLGCLVGHLAAYEMTSSVPCRMYGNGFRRNGYDPAVTWYFDEHVEADAVHEQIAGRDLAGGLIEAEPELLDDVLFGAAACLAIDDWVAEEVMAAWKAGVSSLRMPLDA